jgi:hypothetical protein
VQSQTKRKEELKGSRESDLDREFIVTRATTAIAQPPRPAKLQSVWVLTTRTTHSTKYRRSGYFPSFSDKQRKENKQTNTNYVQKGALHSRCQLPKEKI